MSPLTKIVSGGWALSSAVEAAYRGLITVAKTREASSNTLILRKLRTWTASTTGFVSAPDRGPQDRTTHSRCGRRLRCHPRRLQWPHGPAREECWRPSRHAAPE